MSEGSGTLSALSKTIAIIEAMTDRGDGVRITELAGELDISKSTVYKHLNTLREAGYVDKDGVVYHLSPRFVDVGEHVRAGLEPCERARPAVDKLAATTDETAGFVLEHAGEAVDVYGVSGDHADQPAAITARHLHCSAAGKAILSQFSDERVAAVLPADLPAVTDHTITDADRLRTELDRIRDRGLSFARGEGRPAVNSVAVPVSFGETTGAVYVAGPAERLSSKRLEEDVPGILLSTVRDLGADADAVTQV